MFRMMVVSSSVRSSRFRKNRSSCQGEQLGEVELLHLDGRGHDSPSEASCPPFAGVGDLGNESVGVEALEDAGDLGALPVLVASAGGKVFTGSEFSPDVFVLETPQATVPVLCQ